MWTRIKNTFTHTEFPIPRQITPRYDHKEVKMIAFSDASKNSYGTAVYLRFSFENGETHTNLLFSKSRVKPAKNKERYTIPRLELLSLVTATNAAVFLTQELKPSLSIEAVEFFSDSMIALGWVSTHKKLKCFVANQVKLIKENCKRLHNNNIGHNLHHCSTDQNPADFVSRGKSTEELFSSSLWMEGPQFLKSPEEQCPARWTDSATNPKWLESAMSEEMTQKIKTKYNLPSDSTAAPVTALITIADEVPVEYHSSVPYHSTNSLNKLIRYVDKVLYKAAAFGEKINKQWTGRIMKKYTNSKDLTGRSQKQKAILEYLILDHYKESAARSSNYIPQELHPVQDQRGFIRHGTRLDKSELPNDTKYPIILMRDHKLTELIVRDLHIQNKHIGTEHLVTKIREKYWIPKCKQLARSVIRTCTVCRRLTGKKFKYPSVPALPSYRVRRSRPFESIGLDYFGPIYYNGRITDKKIWVMICTCLVTRNIHLEVVPDNTTYQFVLAMRRFFARRGTPRRVVLDNARTFKLGERIFNGDIKQITPQIRRRPDQMGNNTLQEKANQTFHHHLVPLEIEYEEDEPRLTEAQPHPEKEEATNETPTTTLEDKKQPGLHKAQRTRPYLDRIVKRNITYQIEFTFFYD
uniref:Integrase catalytic domain-containing protein n=1 Tax=Caenorhabditis japonica TaxID=281687 RepID=A0A8R1I8Z3_CAEJA